MFQFKNSSLSIADDAFKWAGKSWNDSSHDTRTFHVVNWISTNVCKQRDRICFTFHRRDNVALVVTKIKIVDHDRDDLSRSNSRRGKACRPSGRTIYETSDRS